MILQLLAIVLIGSTALPATSRYDEEIHFRDCLEKREKCESELRINPKDSSAAYCHKKAVKDCERLAKNAYTQGYILQAQSQNAEAKKYYLKAKKFVRKGDEYFDRISKKLKELE